MVGLCRGRDGVWDAGTTHGRPWNDGNDSGVGGWGVVSEALTTGAYVLRMKETVGHDWLCFLEGSLELSAFLKYLEGSRTVPF